jgi:hypothetical protein
MATRWAKQLSLSKEMNSDQDSQEKFDLKEQPENRTTSLSTIFSSEVLKDANQYSLKDWQVMILMIESSILLAWPLLPAGVHSLDRVAI